MGRGWTHAIARYYPSAKLGDYTCDDKLINIILGDSAMQPHVP